MAARHVVVKKYVVRLSEEERAQLEALIGKGKSAARRLTKARILLKADVSDAGEGWSDGEIVRALGVSICLVQRTRRQLVEAGLEAALNRKPRATPAVAPIFDGEKQAKLTALACSAPPAGYARWSLRLLEQKVVELGIVDRASDSTIGRVLKKTRSSPIADSAG
jgi:hypothetical protein